MPGDERPSAQFEKGHSHIVRSFNFETSPGGWHDDQRNDSRSSGTANFFFGALPDTAAACTSAAAARAEKETPCGLVTLLHDASVERLQRPNIVRIELGERVDLLCRDVHRSLQYNPRDAFTARRSC